MRPSGQQTIVGLWANTTSPVTTSAPSSTRKPTESLEWPGSGTTSMASDTPGNSRGPGPSVPDATPSTGAPKTRPASSAHSAWSK